jgi:alpha-N-arabinofuranosidase
MYAVNMGTGTPQDAGYVVEYANFPGGTYWSDLRKQNGHKDAHNIKLWCVGNEMDGPWQTCGMDAREYGKKARETAKIMKWVDPSIELAACGSAGSHMPSYPEWDRIVLEEAWDYVDYISLHRYYENFGNNDNFLASWWEMDEFIKAVCATADYVRTLKRSKKRMMLSFDEWNIWYQAKQTPHSWMRAPHILEDNYSLLDAIAFGGLLCTLINNADRVRIGCLAQMVNVIAPIFTEKGGKAIKQTTYYPFQMASANCKGQAMRIIGKVPEIETEQYGPVPSMPMAATWDEEANALSVLIANNGDKPETLEFDLRSFGKAAVVEHTYIQGPDLNAVNTFQNPDAVRAQTETPNAPASGNVELSVAPKSFNLFKLVL